MKNALYSVLLAIIGIHGASAFQEDRQLIITNNFDETVQVTTRTDQQDSLNLLLPKFSLLIIPFRERVEAVYLEPTRDPLETLKELFNIEPQNYGAQVQQKLDTADIWQELFSNAEIDINPTRGPLSVVEPYKVSVNLVEGDVDMRSLLPDSKQLLDVFKLTKEALSQDPHAPLSAHDILYTPQKVSLQTVTHNYQFFKKIWQDIKRDAPPEDTEFIDRIIQILDVAYKIAQLEHSNKDVQNEKKQWREILRALLELNNPNN